MKGRQTGDQRQLFYAFNLDDRIAGHHLPGSDAGTGALTKCKANTSWKTYEMACGHDAMVIQRDSLVEILTELARPLLRPSFARP